MSPSQRRHELRRQRDQLELALFAGGAAAAPTGPEVQALLEPLAAGLAAEEQERVAALARVAAAPARREGYLALHGACGVRRFDTDGGAAIYLVPIETFPNHVNNLYLVIEGARATLVDAGTGTAQTRAELARAGQLLAALHGLDDVWSRVRHVVITHGHIDHFGGVAAWRARGARVWLHELDARVLTHFQERILVAASDVRRFFQRAGVDAAERAALLELYVRTKDFFQPVPIDHALGDGEEVEGGYVAHHVPGHCPGQICLQVHDVLLTADHVLSRITPHQSPEAITPFTGLGHYLDSLAKIRRVPGIDLALGGHEEPIPRLAKRLTEIERFHRARLDRVLGLCTARERTVAEVADELFGPQPGYGRILALQEAGAHVEYLHLRGALGIANVADYEREPDPVTRYRASVPVAAPPP